jgi:hypothetical protein
MGAQHTKGDTSVGHLTPEECSILKKVFTKISSTGGEKNSGPGCSYRSFQMYCESHLDDWLARKISDKLATKNIKTNELQIPLHNFLNFVSSTLKGSFEEKFEIIWSLAVETPSEETKTILAGEILQYTRSIIESYIKCTESLPSSRSWAHAPHMTSDSVTDLAYHILLELFHNGVAPKDIIGTPEVILHSRKHATTQPSSYSMEQVLTAFSKSVLFLNLQNSILSHCFDFEKTTYFNPALIPHCFKPVGIDADNITLLDYPRLIYLNSQLAPELRKQWRFLFSTASHGESFSKFLENIQEKGHTLIIVRDTGGHVFGGYAPQSWKIGPKFFGNEQSFLFHLSPRFVTYSTTGYNKNFLYLNVQQKTFPNGLGFGGTLEYFGLWLDSEFGKGKCSPSCSTYTNPQLSSSPEFDVEHLEVWALGPEPKNENDDENERNPGKSILDKDPEARAMLDIIGKRAHSDGYRDIPKE